MPTDEELDEATSTLGAYRDPAIRRAVAVVLGRLAALSAQRDEAREREAGLREECEALARKWRDQATVSREEANRIRATIKAATDAEERCNVRSEVWRSCAAELEKATATHTPGGSALRPGGRC